MDSKAVVRFTEAEAKEKIGHEVRSLIEFAGVPRDTLGRVVSVHEFDSGSFDVVVEWNLPHRKNPKDRFAKGPYEEFLTEEITQMAYA